MRQHAVKLVLSLIIAAAFVWVLERGGLPILPARESLSRVAWWTIPAALLTQIVSSYWRTYRWYYLLRPIDPTANPKRILGIGLVGFTAILFAPLRLGEVARPYLISLDRRVSFSQALGTVGAERVIDGLIVTAALLAAMLYTTQLSPLPDHLGDLPLPIAVIPAAAYSALAIFSCAFIAMGVFYWAREPARRLTHAVVGLVSHRAAEFLAKRVERLADGLRFLPALRNSGPFLRDTVLYWTVIAMGQWAVLNGCGVQASLSETWVTVGVMGLGTLIPAGPGFFGAFQLSAYCGLAMFFPASVVLEAGAAFVFITYVTQLAVSVLACGVGVLLMARTTRGSTS